MIGLLLPLSVWACLRESWVHLGRSRRDRLRLKTERTPRPAQGPRRPRPSTARIRRRSKIPKRRGQRPRPQLLVGRRRRVHRRLPLHRPRQLATLRRTQQLAMLRRQAYHLQPVSGPPQARSWKRKKDVHCP